MSTLPFRQIHLDFHTSEQIPDVGNLFDKRQFQEALRLGHVNGINVFAKCHHSWSYYPTQVGTMHPTLTRNLLGEQIEACHEIGIRAPIYYTVGWSANDALTHPEWTVRARDGSIRAANYDLTAEPADARPACSWQFLCPSGEYLELMLEQTREICDLFPVDGFWYDICQGSGVCYCANCLAGMAKEGLNSENEADARKYYVATWQRFLSACNSIILGKHPQASTYYNGMTKEFSPDFTPWMTQIELEDLPTTWGGYDKFPLRCKFFATKGKGIVAMSGKFHTSWGEFGGFKHPDAIRYEAAAMVSLGAACCFGDQLHPSGVVDLSTYRNIGNAYEYVEQIEEYGRSGEMCSNLGLWVSNNTPHDQGVANMLLESQIDFRIAAPDGDLSTFETIILTGEPCLDPESASCLSAFVEEGGSMLVLGASALDVEGKRFLLDLGAEYVGPANYVQDYLVAGPKLAVYADASPFLNYTAALRTRLTDGEVLAAIREPYFDRTYGHYCSHQNTPNQLDDASHPGAIQKGRIVFLPHPLGLIYHQHGARVHREFFVNALGLIYKRPTLAVKMPSGGRVNLLHQPEQKRYVAHLLYGPPLQRGRCLVIEDLVPLYNIPLQLDVPQEIRQAYLAPEEEELPVDRGASAISVVVPRVECHQIVVFTY